MATISKNGKFTASGSRDSSFPSDLLNLKLVVHGTGLLVVY